MKSQIPAARTPEISNAQAEYTEVLRDAEENVLFSFHVEDSQKILSICEAKDQSYIVYRYGTENHIELEYPEDKTDSWNKFAYSTAYSPSGGVGSELSFGNGGYRYDIYQYNSADSGEPMQVYATVKSLTMSATISVISGQSGSAVGDLSSLKANTKLGTSPYTMQLYTVPDQGNSIQIEYPQFNGSSYDKVNRMIYQHVLDTVTSFVPDSSPDDYGLEIFYQSAVTLQNSNIISVIFRGVYYYEGAAHPNSGFDTLNIDLSTLEEITLTDMYTFNADFEKIVYEKAQQVSGVDGMIERAQSGNDSVSMDSLTKYTDYLIGYLTPGGVGISVSTQHALGDHFEVWLKYSDIQQFYN